MTTKQLHNRISAFMESIGFEIYEKFTAYGNGESQFSTFMNKNLLFVFTKNDADTILIVEVGDDKSEKTIECKNLEDFIQKMLNHF